MSVKDRNESKELPKEKTNFVNFYKEEEADKPQGIAGVIHFIWPVKHRKRKTADTGELFIKTTLRNLILYFVYLGTICFIVYGMVGLINYHFSNGMLSLFIDTPSSTTDMTKTFRLQFVEEGDLWDFFLGGDRDGNSPFLNGLYFDTWYDGTSTSAANLGYIFYQNKLLGPPRIMQVRVKDNSCKIGSQAAKIMTNCASSYFDWAMSKDTWGYGLNLSTSDPTYAAWQWTEDKQKAGAYWGQTGIYPASGFMQTLNQTDRAASFQILQSLYTNRWIDQFTRVVFIDFTVYNGNVNLFNQMRLIIEFPSTGGMFNAWTVRTSKLLRYVSSQDFAVAAFEILFIIFTVYYTLEEVVAIGFFGRAYLKDPYNLIDWFILGLSYTTIILSLYRTIAVSVLLDSLLANTNQFANFDTLTYCQELFNQASAIMIFFAWIKVFKYISLNKTLDQLSSTLKRSAKDIMYFIVIFFIVFFAYGAMGFLLFGETIPDYQNFPKTLFTLFRLLLGDFDFVTLRTFFPILGPLFFASFVFIGFFVLLNMFMAIINDSYSKVKEEMEENEPEFMLSDYLKKNYGKVVTRMNLRRNRIMDIEEVLKSEEVAGKNELDFGTWRKMLKKKGYADMEIESLFARYDKDSDHKLNELEKLKLVRDITKARKNITEEFKNFKDKRVSKMKKDAFEVGDDEPADAAPVLGPNGEPVAPVSEEPEARQMTRDDFEYAVGRIDRMELSVANIINKIDRLFAHLERMEIEKMKKHQEIASKLKA